MLLLLLLFAFTLNYKKLLQAEGPREQLKNNGTNTLHTEWTLNGCVCVCYSGCRDQHFTVSDVCVWRV